jgi:hypothetical protein
MFPNYFIFNNNSLIMQLKRLSSRGNMGVNNPPIQNNTEPTKSSFTNMNLEELINTTEPNNLTIDINNRDEHNLEIYKTFSDFSLAAHHIMEEIGKKETPSNTTEKLTFSSLNSVEPRLQFKYDSGSFFNNNENRLIESMFLTRSVNLNQNKGNYTQESINPYTFLDSKSNEIRLLFSDPNRTLTASSVSKASLQERVETRASALDVTNLGGQMPIEDLMNESRARLNKLINSPRKTVKKEACPLLLQVNNF